MLEEIKEKIEEDTFFDSWYGIDAKGRKIKIETDVLLKWAYSNNNETFIDIATSGDAIMLPDGAKLVRTLSAAKSMGWDEIRQDLEHYVKLTNKLNGFEV